MDKPIRQGDILLTPVVDRAERGRIRRNGETVPRERGEGIVVAEGEATGHHHRIRTKDARMIRRGSSLFVVAPRGGAELEHEEHETLTIPQGMHRVSNQREYAPAAAPRRVYD